MSLRKPGREPSSLRNLVQFCLPNLKWEIPSDLLWPRPQDPGVASLTPPPRSQSRPWAPAHLFEQLQVHSPLVEGLQGSPGLLGQEGFFTEGHRLALEERSSS